MAKKKDTKPKQKPKTTAMAKQPDEQTAVSMYQDEASHGMEEMTSEDVAIPFLKIIQSNSPQLEKNNADRIEGAEQGNIFNSVTQIAMEEFEAIPCAFERPFVEWIPREDGGGFIGTHLRTSDEVKNAVMQDYKNKMRLMTDRRTELVDTANHYILFRQSPEDEWTMAMIAMASTNLTTSRRWNTLQRSKHMRNSEGMKFVPPTYAHIYNVTTVGKTNAKGSYFVFQVTDSALQQDPDVHAEAKALHDIVVSGRAKVNQAEASGADSDGKETEVY